MCGKGRTMAIQNTSKKPNFNKIVLGYAPKEVDRYIDFISERYNAVCRENAELKRKLTRLQLGITTNNSDTAEAVSETEIKDEKRMLTKSELAALAKMIREEKERHESSLDMIYSLIESLTDTSLGEIPFETVSDETGDESVEADDDWECILEKYISDIPQTDEDDSAESFFPFVEDAELDADFKKAKDTVDRADTELLFTKKEVFTSDDDGFVELFDDGEDSDEAVDTVETDAVDDSEFAEEIIDEIMGDIDSLIIDEETDDGTPVSEDNAEITDKTDATDTAEEPLTAAQRAALLDFYTDEDIPDGQSFDPMTLAVAKTRKSRRPSGIDVLCPTENKKK